jgi:hypothetical protein
MMTNQMTAFRRPSARLLARACLFALLAFAGLTHVCARRASAQTLVQAYSTSYGAKPEDACGGRLVLVATSGRVEGNPAPAEAFSFVLVPRGEGKQRIFSVYSLGAAPRLRDDDEGQFALRPYDNIKKNLGTFFDKAGCKLDERALEALSDTLDKNATGLSVEKFARAAEVGWPEGFADLTLVQSDRKNIETWANQESFARFVNGFAVTLPLPADGQVIALAKQFSEQKALADKSASEAAELRRRIDSSFLLSR